MSLSLTLSFIVLTFIFTVNDTHMEELVFY